MRTVLLVIGLAAFGWGETRPIKKCSDIQLASFGSDVKIESATLVAAKGKMPEHCDVRGVIWPENRFALELPTEWNSRFNMVGNGGSAGVLRMELMDNALGRGFATATTDTGHDDTKEPGASFAERSPKNTNWARKVDDFAFLAPHETAVVAKRTIQFYYGEQPRHSYWTGCSTGGRQGLMEAQRYPNDFDGIVVGAPVLDHTGTLMRHIWNGQAVQQGPGRIGAEKLPTLARAVYGKCDALDGLADGIIENPLRCNFDPAIDVPKCTEYKDAPDCFTAAQIASLKNVYGGVRNSSGKVLFPGQLPGAEIGWAGSIVGDSVGLKLAETYIRYMAFEPPPGPGWSFKDFNFDVDPQKLAGIAGKVNATSPDLNALWKRGGKVIHYHGWADQAATALMSVHYYGAVLERFGKKETDNFYRFFPIPGMAHCRGGPGCGEVDWLTPITNWVEKGIAPDKLIGAHVENGKATRTRPLCPFPQVARYQGSGSIDEAENFTCVAEPR